MKNLVTILLIGLSLNSFCQEEKIVFSDKYLNYERPFTKVTLIDERVSVNLGYVQKGGFNRITPVVYDGDFTESFKKFYTTGQSQNPRKEIAIILYELFMNERGQGMNGRIKIGLRAFENVNEDSYKEIFVIDSVFEYGGLDVTHKLIAKLSENLCTIGKFICEGRNNISTDKTYTLEQLNNLDSLEKMEIPAFSTDFMKPGIYYSYKQFKLNEPDTASVYIDTSEKQIRVFRMKKGKPRSELPCETVYAVCDGKILCKATTIGYYRLRKEGTDYYYEGKTSFSTSNDNTEVAAAAVMFGLVGALAAAASTPSNGATDLFLYKINYRKGNSIPIKPIFKKKKPEQ